MSESKEPRVPTSFQEKLNAKRIIIVLEQASLETVKTKKGFTLLNCDDHQGLQKRLGKDPGSSRPDISHQLLLNLLDSPLNKAGLLQVYIHTDSNVLIEVSPHLRIPRTYKRFAGLMVQLLHKMKIRSSDGKKTLLRVIKNPITAHLPPGAPIIATSMKGKLIPPTDLAAALPRDKPLVFVVGAMAKGFIEPDYAHKFVSLSNYALSAATAVSRLLGAFEDAWGIV